MNPPLVKGFRHTGIITKNISKSLNFYVNILGLKIIEEFFENGSYIEEITGYKNLEAHFYKLQANDGTVIELLEYPSHPTKTISQTIINVGVCHIAFRVGNAEYAYKTLKNDNVKVLSLPKESTCGKAKVFFCLDPDKVRIEIVEMLK